MNKFTELLAHHKAVISLVEDIIEWHKIAVNPEMSHEEVVKLYDQLFQDEIEEMSEEVSYTDAWSKEIADCCFVGLYIAYLSDDEAGLFNYIEELVEDYDSFSWLKKVTENNWEKFPEYEDYYCNPELKGLILSDMELFVQDQLEQEAKAIEAKHEGRYKGVTYQVVETKARGEVVIFSDNKGKVLKPLSFQELNYK